MKKAIHIQWIFLFLLSAELLAQNAPISTAGTFSTIGSTAIVSITAANFNNISSCNLELNYDPAIAGNVTLNYFLPVKGTVLLEILNMTGKKITTLVDQVEQEGDHRLQISSARIRPGIYTVRIMLRAENNLMTRCIKIICYE